MKRRPCETCQHAERARIDFLLARGETVAAIGRKFGLSVFTLRRHSENHISQEYRSVVSSSPLESLESLQKLACNAGESVLDNMSALYSAYAGRFLTAFEAGDDYKVSKIGLRMESILEMKARISKELLPSGSTFNTVNNNLLLTDAGQLLKILAPFPEARKAIVDYYSEKASPRVIEHHAAD
jgi:hypothetical protein